MFSVSENKKIYLSSVCVCASTCAPLRACMCLCVAYMQTDTVDHALRHAYIPHPNHPQTDCAGQCYS